MSKIARRFDQEKVTSKSRVGVGKDEQLLFKKKKNKLIIIIIMYLLRQNFSLPKKL